MADDTRTVYPDRASWLLARRSGLGSSDAAAILGLSPFVTPLAVYADKLGLSEEMPDNERLEWGRRLEPVVAEKYSEVTERTLAPYVPFAVFRHATIAFLLATPDRQVVAPSPDGLLEVKTTGVTGEWGDEPPLYVLIQFQHQLAVTGLSWGSIAVLIGGQRFFWYDVPRDDRFIALLIEREALFWERLQRLEPPAVLPADHALLSAIYRQEAPGTAVALPQEALDWDRARREAMTRIDEATLVKEEAEARLKACLKEAVVGTLPGGAGRYRWATERRPAYSVAEWSGRVLRRVK
jgi:putative phage-type endonuclease